MAISARASIASRLGSGGVWAGCVLVCWALGSAAASLRIPSAHLFVSAGVGLALALGGWVRKQFPERMTTAAQAVIGSLVGVYIDFHTMRVTGPEVLALTVATVSTIGLCLVVGWRLPRSVPVDQAEAVLGMVPGNPSAMVMVADDMGADSRIVAVIQYVRVAVIAASIPVVLLAVGSGASGDDGNSSVRSRFADGLRLVESENQLRGVVGLIAVCATGYLGARLLRLPAPAILGPLLLSAALPQLINHQTLPSEMAREFMFVIVGLEIGLRFQRESLRKVLPLVRGVASAALMMGLICAVIALGLAAAVDISYLDAYLATAPGGLNPILATGVSAEGNVGFIASMQTLRLVMMIILTALSARWLVKRFSDPAEPAR